MPEIASAVFEEFIEDTKALTNSLIQWGDRWTTIGEQLCDTASESQRDEIKKVVTEFVTAIQTMGQPQS